MKNVGSKAEFAQERGRDLLRAYFRCLQLCDRVCMPDIFKAVVNMPAKRFWVSPWRATVVVGAIERGESIRHMRPTKQEMFHEILRRVNVLRQSYPGVCLSRLVEQVVQQPAPKFYLSPGSAKIYILKARKQWFGTKR